MVLWEELLNFKNIYHLFYNLKIIEKINIDDPRSSSDYCPRDSNDEEEITDIDENNDMIDSPKSCPNTEW